MGSSLKFYLSSQISSLLRRISCTYLYPQVSHAVSKVSTQVSNAGEQTSPLSRTQQASFSPVSLIFMCWSVCSDWPLLFHIKSFCLYFKTHFKYQQNLSSPLQQSNHWLLWFKWHFHVPLVLHISQCLQGCLFNMSAYFSNEGQSTPHPLLEPHFFGTVPVTYSPYFFFVECWLLNAYVLLCVPFLGFHWNTHIFSRLNIFSMILLGVPHFSKAIFLISIFLKTYVWTIA